MRRVIAATLAAAGMSLGAAAQGPAPTSAAPKPVASHAPDVATAEGQTAVVKQYCSTCHNDKMKAGDLTHAEFDATHVLDNAETVEKMIRKLRAGMMPPAGVKRPDEATIAALADAFESHIDMAAAARPNAGWRPSQRLN